MIVLGARCRTKLDPARGPCEDQRIETADPRQKEPDAFPLFLVRMVESNGVPRVTPIDEAKVQSVVTLCDELRALSPDDPQYGVVLRRLDEHWRALSPAEQDEVDRIFGQQGLVRDK